VIREKLDPMRGTAEDVGITMRQLAAFHFPLTLATMTMILSMPMVSWALNNSPQGKTALAAWGIAMSVVFMFRSITFALPETVIALYRDDQTRDELSRFCRNVGIGCAIAILVVFFSRASFLFFVHVLDSTPLVANVASLLLLSSVLIPLVNSHASFLRGMLTYHHNTQARLWAIVASISALAAALFIGVALRVDGIVMVGVATTVQIVAETAVLRAFWARTLPPQGTETALDVVP
jgi:O-antigen/teichoic acid export membrane protein